MARCENLAIIDIQNCAAITNPVLQAIATRGTNLLELRINGYFSSVNLEAGFLDIATKCTNLRTVSICKSLGATDSVLTTIAANCPELREFEFGIKPNEKELRRNAGLLAIATQCRKLTKFNVIASAISDAVFTALADNCPELSELLRTQGSSFESSRGMLPVVRQCKKLRKITLGIGLDNEVFQALGTNSEELRELEINSFTLPESLFVKVVAKLKKLTVLHFFTGSRTLSDNALFALGENCPMLETLSLRSPTVTDAGLIAIATGCPHLRDLEIHGKTISDGGLAVLAERCPQMTNLKIKESTGISDAGLRSIARMQALSTFHVHDCPNISDKGILYVAERLGRKLRALDFGLTGNRLKFSFFSEAAPHIRSGLLTPDMELTPSFGHFEKTLRNKLQVYAPRCKIS